MKKFLISLVTAFVFFSIQTTTAQLSCAGKTTVNFNFTGAAQTFTVPAGVTTITIKTRGATGGLASATANSAGGGAIIEGDYAVTPGQVVTILVGGVGVNGDFESGGGGATGVYIAGTLYIVAGGGGGEDNTGNGGVGVIANNGTNGAPINVSTNCPTDDVNNSLGGAAGNGGNAGEICAANLNGGGGGGGLNTAGGGKTGNYGGGGLGSITGAAGGVAGTGGAAGGWGWSGGGGADDRESGGGGGYSGGGGAGEGGNPGGGGSFLKTGFTSSFTANGAITTTALAGLVTICYTVVVPLTIIDFSGTANNTGNYLNWKTANENNVHKIIIERSANNVNFTAVGEAVPFNNAQEHTYQFQDNNVAGISKLYYRLKITDLDGGSKFSSVILLRNNQKPGDIYLWPNPVTDKVTVSMFSGVNTNVAVRITDALGKTVNLISYNIAKGNNQINITNLDKMAKGVYLLEVKDKAGNIQFVQKLIKK